MTTRDDWFVTVSGRRFSVTDPSPDDVDIGDIAHALSLLCRFGGHVTEFYSVAQHCVHVSRLVPRTLALHGLMHDATEAYCGDVIGPLKRQIGERYTEIEKGIERAIRVRFGLSQLSPEEAAVIKHADTSALLTERRDLKPGAARVMWQEDRAGVVADLNRIVPLSPEAARAAFMHRFVALWKSA